MMTRNIWCLLGLLLLSVFGVSDAVDANCDFQQKLDPGRTYVIANPNYPYSYAPSTSCRWYATSDTRVKITCNEFNVDPTPNCVGDSLNVYTNLALGPRKYCGFGTFSTESEGNEMVITLTTASDTQGGTFRCYLEATANDEQCSCGWKNPSRIVGGVETGVNEFPMMAALVNVRSQSVFCGATIISNKHVLTAAHCLDGFSVNNIGVLVGDHDLTTGADTSAAQLFRVEMFVSHPLYVTNNNDYDLAVITVSGTIAFTNAVGPACLPFRNSRQSFEGAIVNILGWGSLEFAGGTSNTLQKATVRVPAASTCQQYFPTVTSRQICTYAEGRDSCQFDSGGPVLWQNPSTRRIVHVGVISYGTYCATDEPAVNTRVSEFLDWIIAVTPGIQYCQLE